MKSSLGEGPPEEQNSEAKTPQRTVTVTQEVSTNIKMKVNLRIAVISCVLHLPAEASGAPLTSGLRLADSSSG